MPTLSTKPEGNTASGAIASCWRAPRGQRTCACTEPPCARTGRSRVRPSGRSPGGPLRERRGGTPEMNERGKSDSPVVPAKPPNKAGEPAAEVVEGRRLAEGNTDSSTRPGRSAGQGVLSGLDRVREVARRDKEARFTALLHHVDLERLRAAYGAMSPKAAPGVDRVTWAAYGQDLEANLRDLHGRVHSGALPGEPVSAGVHPEGGRAAAAARHRHAWRTRSSSGPSSRCSTPSTRWTSWASPTGSGRGAARTMRWMRWRSGSSEKKVNWVLDADIRDFFDQLDRGWLQKFLGHRIADKRVLRLIDKWLSAGVIEDGEMVGDGGGNTTGGIGFAVARERVPALRLGPVGRWWRTQARAR